MDNDRFKIIFERVGPAGENLPASQGTIEDFEAITLETEAIAELMEIVHETVEPPAKLYTTT